MTRTIEEVRPQRVAPWLIVLLAALVIAAVVVFGLLIRDNAGFAAADLGFLQAVNATLSPAMDAVAVFINWFLGPVGAAVITLVIAVAIFAVKRRPTPALVFLFLVLVPWLGNTIVKEIVRRPRPDLGALYANLIPDPISFSYPSGHTCFATALCLALLVTLGHGRWRIPLIVVAVVVPLLTAYSRVYLGVHYLSDVIAALVYTSAASTIVIIATGRWRALPAPEIDA